jgi:hypothetical protein
MEIQTIEIYLILITGNILTYTRESAITMTMYNLSNNLLIIFVIFVIYRMLDHLNLFYHIMNYIIKKRQKNEIE